MWSLTCTYVIRMHTVERNLRADMMGDAVDDAFEDDEEESAEIMNQV